MGCDIHFVIEQQMAVKGVMKWVGVCKGYDYHFEGYTPFDARSNFQKLGSRNYRFFGLLANVRGSGDEEPRGIPEDVSDLAAADIEHWGEDGHSHSWHSLEEFVRKYLLAQDDAAVLTAMTDRLAGENPVHKFFNIEPEEWPLFRVVFWFDN